MVAKRIYRVIFQNQGEVYELYARKVDQAGMYAFVEVEELIFGERSQVLVDPAEERLKSEFENVKRTYIPLQAVIRIDEVAKEGQNRIHKASGDGKIANFPPPPKPPGRSE
ncbi:MAG: DUF1820 family protein [Gammaproteobacteria bacterium]|jgi:hypothetical protein